MRKYTIDDMYKIANDRGGVCLSDYYVNKRIKLSWMCSEGHKWDATSDSVIHGSWCPVCAKSVRLHIDDMRIIAKSKGGMCLSVNYVNNKSKLTWECSEGHIWEAIPNNIKRGIWCPICAGNKSYNIKEMKELAKKRGGKCLSAAYVNSKTKLLWKCSENHKWEATPHDIINGSWCPTCHKLKIVNGEITMKTIVSMKQISDVFEIGRICIKLSGKDVGKLCVVIDLVNDITVFVDGYGRRKKCNIKHLEQTAYVLNIFKGITHDDLIRVLESENMPPELKQMM